MSMYSCSAGKCRDWETWTDADLLMADSSPMASATVLTGYQILTCHSYLTRFNKSVAHFWNRFENLSPHLPVLSPFMTCAKSWWEHLVISWLCGIHAGVWCNLKWEMFLGLSSCGKEMAVWSARLCNLFDGLGEGSRYNINSTSYM